MQVLYISERCTTTNIWLHSAGILYITDPVCSHSQSPASLSASVSTKTYHQHPFSQLHLLHHDAVPVMHIHMLVLCRSCAAHVMSAALTDVWVILHMSGCFYRYQAASTDVGLILKMATALTDVSCSYRCQANLTDVRLLLQPSGCAHVISLVAHVMSCMAQVISCVAHVK